MPAPVRDIGKTKKSLLRMEGLEAAAPDPMIPRSDSLAQGRLNNSPDSLRVRYSGIVGVLLSRVRRAVGPPACGDHEYVDWFRSAAELWIQHDGRLRQICAPNATIHKRSVKHQVRHPVVSTLIRQVLVLRHHVRHGPRLQRRQSLFHKLLDAVDDLSFRLTGQHHFRSFVRHRQDGAGSRRIEAHRTSNFRVPKISRQSTLEWAHPPALHHAYETIPALDGCFIAMRPKYQNLRIVGYRVWSRTSCQGYFGISIRHQVLVKRGHAGISGLGLCVHLQARTQRETQHAASDSDYLGCPSAHAFPLSPRIVGRSGFYDAATPLANSIHTSLATCK